MSFTFDQIRKQVEESEKGIPYAHKTKDAKLKGINDYFKAQYTPHVLSDIRGKE